MQKILIIPPKKQTESSNCNVVPSKKFVSLISKNYIPVFIIGITLYLILFREILNINTLNILFMPMWLPKLSWIKTTFQQQKKQAS